MFDFSEKVVMVTGATSGIGLATARQFAKAGARVVLSGRRSEIGEKAASDIRANGGEACFIRADVSHEEDVVALIDGTLQRYGGLDVAFNNAGVVETMQGIGIDEKPSEEFDRVFATNVTGVFYCLKHEVAVMKARGGGAIVNNASVGGMNSLPGISIYASSKHAVIGLTRSAALDTAQQGIRVNAIAPYGTATELLIDPAQADWMRNNVPIGRLCEPDEQAHAVMYLASDAASYITGVTLPVDGGISCCLKT